MLPILRQRRKVARLAAEGLPARHYVLRAKAEVENELRYHRQRQLPPPGPLRRDARCGGGDFIGLCA